MEKELFAVTKNGQSVWFDPKGSHAATHFLADPKLPQYIKDAIEDLEAAEPNIYTEVDCGQPIGHSDLVATDLTDEIIYAKRVGRATFTRFTKSRQPAPTNSVTIWLVRREDNDYDLMSAWFGLKTPPLPGDEWETPESKPFWANHALVWGKQAVIEGTETATCPW